MSTLTSRDFVVNRSTTRVHAPPGGGSSLSFGQGGFSTSTSLIPSNNSTIPSNVNPRNHLVSQPRHSTQSMIQPQDSAQQLGSLSKLNLGVNNLYKQEINPAFDAYNTNQQVSNSQEKNNCSFSSTRPLTSSQRDQNWQHKRNNWLQRNQYKKSKMNHPIKPSFEEDTVRTNHFSSSNHQVEGPSSPLTKLVSSYQTPRNNTYVNSSSNNNQYQGNRETHVNVSGAISYSQLQKNVFIQSGLKQCTGQEKQPQRKKPTVAVSQPPGGHTTWSPFSGY